MVTPAYAAVDVVPGYVPTHVSGSGCRILPGVPLFVSRFPNEYWQTHPEDARGTDAYHSLARSVLRTTD